MLLQTKDVQHLYVSYVDDMLKLWLKHGYFYAQTTLHLIRVMKMCLGLEYSVCSSQTWLEMSKTLMKKIPAFVAENSAGNVPNTSKKQFWSLQTWLEMS